MDFTSRNVALLSDARSAKHGDDKWPICPTLSKKAQQQVAMCLRSLQGLGSKLIANIYATAESRQLSRIIGVNKVMFRDRILAPWRKEIKAQKKTERESTRLAAESSSLKACSLSEEAERRCWETQPKIFEER